MRAISLTLMLFLLSAQVAAQIEATVSGRIVDRQTQTPVPYFSVTILAEGESEPLTGILTDAQGRFVISGLAKGNYQVVATLAGYRALTRDLVVGGRNENFDLGKIEAVKERELEEIVATAQQQAIDNTSLDRRVFSLENNFAQANGSLLDAMKALPGITVDQEGKVQLRGSDKVIILIDGKPSSLTGYGNQRGLDSIPAANAETIEIINNPSARYDAAGMAGVINISYKKNQTSGFSGDVGLALAVGQLDQRKDDLPTQLGSYDNNQKITPSFTLNYNTDSITYFLQGEVLVQDDLPNNEFTTRTYSDGLVVLSQVPENREQIHSILKGGLDWFITDNDDLSFTLIYDYEDHTDEAQVPYINAANGEIFRYWFWEENEITGHANASLSYKHLFPEPGHELSVSIQFTRGWEDESYYLNEDSPVRIGVDETHLDAEENTLPIQIDYIKPLGYGRLEAGAKFQKRWLPITYDVVRGEQSAIYPGLGRESEWGEDIYAGYLNYVREREQYAIEAGVRLEQTDVYYDLPANNIYYSESDAYDYFDAFPNLRLTYNLNDNNSIAAYYGNRIDRPGEPELRIFPKYDDPELSKVGNPYLRPQYTESFELAYERVWDSGSAIVSIYRRNIDDPYTRIYFADTENPDYRIIFKMYQNFGSAADHGLELILSQDVSETWDISASLNWYRHEIDRYQVLLRFPFQRQMTVQGSDDDTWDAKLTNRVQLPFDMELQLTLVYYDERNIAQGTEDARSSIDLGIKKALFNDKGEIVFSFSDMFNNFGIKQNIENELFNAVYENYYETQVMSLGMKYRF